MNNTKKNIRVYTLGVLTLIAAINLLLILDPPELISPLAYLCLLGSVLIGTGETFYQIQMRRVALIITIIGCVALFAGAAFGFTDGLWMDGLFGICASVSLLIFVALTRHNSQYIAVVGLVIGYFPLALVGALPYILRVFYSPLTWLFFGLPCEQSFSLLFEELTESYPFVDLAYYVLLPCVYATLLTLYILFLSVWKSWRVMRLVGLFMGLIVGFALCANVLFSIVDVDDKFDLRDFAVFGASFFVLFLAHLTIPVFRAWFIKEHIRKADIALLSCSIFGYFLLACYWVSPIYFIAPAFFAVCCICMAFITEWKKRRGTPEIDHLRNLFFILSVTFTVLIGLFEVIVSEALDGSFYLITIGWPIFTAGLAVYGILKNSRRFIIAAEVMGVCCIISLITVNVEWLRDWIYDNVYYYIFDWFLVGSCNVSNIDLYALHQYISTIIAWIIVAFATLRVKPQRKSVDIGLNIFRGVAIINLWTVLVFLFDAMPWSQNLFFDDQDWWFVWLTDYYDDFTFTYIVIATFTLGLVLAYFIPKIKRTYNYGFHIASVALGLGSIVLLMAYNNSDPFCINGWLATYKRGFSISYEVTYGLTIEGNILMAFYIVANILAVCFIYDNSRYITRFPVTWRPLLNMGFVVLLVIKNLIAGLFWENYGFAFSIALVLVVGFAALYCFLFVRRLKASDK